MLKRVNDPLALQRAPRLFPVEVRNISFHGSKRLLLDDVSMHLGARGKTVIMGPNGAGKSLLVRILHGLIEPTSGRVLWAGCEADASVRRRQAMVFQRAVMLRRSALANIRFVLRGLSRQMEQARAEAILEKAGLTHVADTPARLLSGGEQQRLAIARALAVLPEVLFLDEPAANLDPAATLAIERLIADAASDGTKIIFITHDTGQARRLADEIVFLHGGRIAEQSDAKTFFDRPQSEEARAYLEGRILL